MSNNKTSNLNKFGIHINSDGTIGLNHDNNSSNNINEQSNVLRGASTTSPEPNNNNNVNVRTTNNSTSDSSSISSQLPGTTTTTTTTTGQNISKTRETVQKVYRLIEKVRTTSTSSSIDDEDLLAASSNNNNNNSKNYNQQQQYRNNSQSQQQRSSQNYRPQYNYNNNGHGPGGRNSSSRRSPSTENARQQSGEAKQTTSSINVQSSCDNSNIDNNIAADATTEETEEESALAKLRCTSIRTELINEREQRRRKRQCSDYPGLAIGLGGGSVFGSDTMMKLSLIKNELYNVINGQLKRAENEVNTFNRRISSIEVDLEKSKENLTTVTNELTEAIQNVIGSSKTTSTDSIVNDNNQHEQEEDDNFGNDCPAILEAKAQIKLIAEESDKVYNDVVRKLIILEKDLEKIDQVAEENEIRFVSEFREAEELKRKEEERSIESKDKYSHEKENESHIDNTTNNGEISGKQVGKSEENERSNQIN